MNRIMLLKTIQNEELYVNILINNGIISIKKCQSSHKNIFLNFETFIFRCNKRNNAAKYATKLSLFNPNHILYKAKINFKTLIMLLYEFSAETNIKNKAFEYNLDSSTVSRYFDKLRKIFVHYYRTNQPKQIRGEGVIVEWNECPLKKNKNNVGRFLASQKWIFGGVTENNPSQIFVEHVVNRSAVVLADVVRHRVRPGTIIRSDCWPAYPGIFVILLDYHLSHFLVNHSENFVDPNSGVHTQTIEGTWSFIKRNLTQLGPNNGDSATIMTKN